MDLTVHLCPPTPAGFGEADIFGFIVGEAAYNFPSAMIESMHVSF